MPRFLAALLPWAPVVVPLLVMLLVAAAKRWLLPALGRLPAAQQQLAVGVAAALVTVLLQQAGVVLPEGTAALSPDALQQLLYAWLGAMGAHSLSKAAGSGGAGGAGPRGRASLVALLALAPALALVLCAAVAGAQPPAQRRVVLTLSDTAPRVGDTLTVTATAYGIDGRRSSGSAVEISTGTPSRVRALAQTERAVRRFVAIDSGGASVFGKWTSQNVSALKQLRVRPAPPPAAARVDTVHVVDTLRVVDTVAVPAAVDTTALLRAVCMEIPVAPGEPFERAGGDTIVVSGALEAGRAGWCVVKFRPVEDGTAWDAVGLASALLTAAGAGVVTRRRP